MIKVTRLPGQRGDVRDYVRVITADAIHGKSTTESLRGGNHNGFLSASAGGNKRLLNERRESWPLVSQWAYRKPSCARLIQHSKSGVAFNLLSCRLTNMGALLVFD